MALFLANFIAGVHSALIIFFLFGWLIPFASLAKRSLAAISIGASFLFFRFFGACPLTVGEDYFRGLAEGMPQQANVWFLEKNLEVFGVSPSRFLVDRFSLFLTLGIVSLALLFLIYAILKKRSGVVFYD